MKGQPKWLHVSLILLVFTCTGLSIVRIGRYISEAAGWERFSAAYWLFWVFGLLPLYNLVLLVFAALFGKFGYFREKQKKTWRKIISWFGARSSDNKNEDNR